ncbi:hypothetical protein Chor_013738, partial [Crotalus horridus]
FVYPEQAVAVAGGIIAGLLLLVLLGIAAYLFWKSKYLKGSYEELTDPVTPVLQEPDVAQSTVPPQNARDGESSQVSSGSSQLGQALGMDNAP